MRARKVLIKHEKYEKWIRIEFYAIDIEKNVSMNANKFHHETAKVLGIGEEWNAMHFTSTGSFGSSFKKIDYGQNWLNLLNVIIHSLYIGRTENWLNKSAWRCALYKNL